MAAQIIVDQSAGKVQRDHDAKEPNSQRQTAAKRSKRTHEDVNERIVRRKVVHIDEAVRSRIKRPADGDPYEGHGVQPDQLQVMWECVVEEQKQRKRAAVNIKTAAQRMEEIRQRIAQKR